ncbi:MAG: hypothetical protein LQ352_002687 [Teloschistes flavicans]|nr:MAG: hypothetical protein LQ352_002687 [Teloschistes flavicans]
MDYQCPPSQAEQPHSVVDSTSPAKKVKKRVPQRNVDEFWDKFTTKFPGKIYSILPENVYAKTKAAQSPAGLVHGQATGKSYEQAAADCRAAVTKIAKECRRVNLKYRDPHFDIEFDLKRNRRDCLDSLSRESNLGPKSVKRVPDIFDNPVFFKEGVSANDVRQGSNGDCWFLSALCALSNKKNLVDRVCVARDEKVGVYGFVFHRDGEWIQTIIDDKLYLIAPDWYESTDDRRTWEEVRRVDAEEEYRKVNQTGSRALCFAQCSDENETWLPLLEKAFAKAHGDYGSIDGGFTGEAIEDLTGGVTTELLATDILDTEQFWTDEVMKVNDEFLFGCATGRFDKWQGSETAEMQGARKGVIRMHAYSIQEAREIKGERLIRIRNPWGDTEWQGAWSDGSEQWTPEWMELLNHRFGDDGMFWISYKDFLRKYQSLDRTRLFGPEWQVTQQWTTANVPWSADFNDTKFDLTITRPGPVVIVLSQLDSRYFRGLEGQYEFQLNFRLEKDDDTEFMVRSHSNYSMSRSVSTDIELEPGTYSVLMKITAKRWSGDVTPDEVVRNNCTGRPEKLIQVGLSYDLAHAKGQIKETEKEKAAREAAEKKKKAADHQKRRAELRADMLKNWETGKKRVARTKRQEARKKAYFAKKAEAAKVAGATVEESAPPETAGEEPPVETSAGEEPPIETSAEQSAQEQPATEGSNEENQGPQAGSEGEVIEAPDSEQAAPLTPPAESQQNQEDEAAWVDEDEQKSGENGEVKKEEEEEEVEETAMADDAAGESEGAAVEEGEGQEAQAEEVGVEEADEDWDLASDASFASSIVTELDLPPLSDESPDTAPVEDSEVDEANAGFEDDPWNAVCVVGLKVYSKDEGLCVQIVRPKHELEEGDTPLDVDDAAKGQSVEKIEEEKEEEEEVAHGGKGVEEAEEKGES